VQGDLPLHLLCIPVADDVRKIPAQHHNFSAIGHHHDVPNMGVWVLAVFWEMPFQLAISPFNLIYRVIEDIGKKVGCILNPEASCRRTMD
jgi:hypothetical protein